MIVLPNCLTWQDATMKLQEAHRLCCTAVGIMSLVLVSATFVPRGSGWLARVDRVRCTVGHSEWATCKFAHLSEGSEYGRRGIASEFLFCALPQNLQQKCIWNRSCMISVIIFLLYFHLLNLLSSLCSFPIDDISDGEI